MITNIVAALLFVVLVCLLIVGICVLINTGIKGEEGKKDKKLSTKKGSISGYVESFYDKVRPCLEELGGVRCIAFARVLMPDRYTELLEDDILEALKQGIEYKRKYKALSKDKQLELRKFCIEQHPDKHSYLSERIGYAETLYQYLTTGKQPENKEEQA